MIMCASHVDPRHGSDGLIVAHIPRSDRRDNSLLNKIGPVRQVLIALGVVTARGPFDTMALIQLIRCREIGMSIQFGEGDYYGTQQE